MTLPEPGDRDDRRADGPAPDGPARAKPGDWRIQLGPPLRLGLPHRRPPSQLPHRVPRQDLRGTPGPTRRGWRGLLRLPAFWLALVALVAGGWRMAAVLTGAWRAYPVATTAAIVFFALYAV